MFLRRSQEIIKTERPLLDRMVIRKLLLISNDMTHPKCSKGTKEVQGGFFARE
jgi:hypothetical protein